MLKYILVDWTANAGRRRMQILLVLFRIANLAHTRFSRRHPLRIVATTFYRQVALSLFAVDLPQQTRVGPRLHLHHGFGIVVHGSATIGADVTLRQAVTIGTRKASGAPCLGDGVEVGAGALILGDIEVGGGAQVGAGAVLTRDVPAGAAVVGNPARLLEQPHSS